MDTDRDLPTDLIPFTQASKIVGTHPATLHRWRLAGKFRAWRRCGRWFASRAELLGLFKLGAPREKPAPLPRTNAKEPAWIGGALRRAGIK